MIKRIAKITRNVPKHWVGDGFPVRSMFSYADGSLYDPFLLLDYADPYQFDPAKEQRGVGEHPHRGFETVTIVYQGELEHRDSAGNSGRIGPGDVQWMTAAGGVVHEEFHSPQFSAAGGTFEVAQLWVNLPAKDKMSPPRYQGIINSDIPVVTLPNGAGTARVIAGELQGTRGPAKTFTPVNLWDLQLSADHTFELTVPDGFTTALVTQRGTVRVNEEEMTQAVDLVLFERAGQGVILRADEDSRVLLLSGQPIGEPIVGQGPFVMNTREEILDAIRDFQAGRMGRLE